MGKHCNNSQCFKEKNYKVKFLINRDNFRKTITKKKHKRKTKSC